MKKILAMFIALVLVAALAVPAMAAISTNVTVSSGGGSLPVIKCKWEQEPIPDLESGDVPHAIPGTQINPPGVKGATKPICYYAVITDDEDGGNVVQAWADVFHPAGCPAPYSTSTDPRGPLFKYEIPFANMGHGSDAKALLSAANTAGLITFGAGHTYATVLEQMNKGTADLWYGCIDIDYEQPAGDYTVKVACADHHDNVSAILENTFLYVPVCSIEVDFTSITYGPVKTQMWKQVAGDAYPFVCPPAPAGYGQTNLATVRNTGNVWAHVKVKQDDMLFGKDGTGAWNVKFAARMGNDDANKVEYWPDVETTLPNYLGLSSQDELDFFIYIYKGFGSHTGTVTIGCVSEPFTSAPPVVLDLDCNQVP